MDITFKLNYDDKSSALVGLLGAMDALLGMYKSDDLVNDVMSPRLEFIPVVANITAGDNVALRHYYKAECKRAPGEDETSPCTEMTLRNKKSVAGFPAKFIFLIHDTRY